jgi:hypothetical protein
MQFQQTLASLMAEVGHSLPKLIVRAASAFPLIATTLRMPRHFAFVPLPDPCTAAIAASLDPRRRGRGASAEPQGLKPKRQKLQRFDDDVQDLCGFGDAHWSHQFAIVLRPEATKLAQFRPCCSNIRSLA